MSHPVCSTVLVRRIMDRILDLDAKSLDTYTSMTSSEKFKFRQYISMRWTELDQYELLHHAFYAGLIVSSMVRALTIYRNHQPTSKGVLEVSAVWKSSFVHRLILYATGSNSLRLYGYTKINALTLQTIGFCRSYILWLGTWSELKDDQIIILTQVIKKVEEFSIVQILSSSKTEVIRSKLLGHLAQMLLKLAIYAESNSLTNSELEIVYSINNKISELTKHE